jgi:hypothetical protein
MSDALRRLSEWGNSTSIDFGGKNGNSGNVPEKPGGFVLPVDFSSGKTGKNLDLDLTGLTASRNAPVRIKALKSLDITGLTALAAENNKAGSGNPARPAAVPKPPAWLNEPGLDPYMIRDFANWYEEEANRRRVFTIIDQDALDRDLRRLLAERGVFPEFIAVEFERVMQVVFPGSVPNPRPRRSDPHEERIAAGTAAGSPARDVLRYGDCCSTCGAARWWNASDAPGWHCMTCDPPPELDDAIRTRLAKSGVPVEALDVEVETEPTPYEVLGSAPAGEGAPSAARATA